MAVITTFVVILSSLLRLDVGDGWERQRNIPWRLLHPLKNSDNNGKLLGSAAIIITILLLSLRMCILSNQGHLILHELPDNLSARSQWCGWRV